MPQDHRTLVRREQQARAAVARAYKARDPEAIKAAQWAYFQVRVETGLDRILADAPPMTEEQRVTIGRILASGLRKTP